MVVQGRAAPSVRGAEGWLGSSRVESEKGILDKIKMSHENGSNFDD
jgi:hypothetical protein